ncbi:MAG: class I SAM-dependent methyltransferase [Lachnospiraceae bacterium]|nr:class I SAM-dependent methyltransferase [Lachnospiraceae bacterium]
MFQKEIEWDRLLRIRTSGRDDSRAGQFCYPYEPTPYCVLERLSSHEFIGKRNRLLDYGCGKGRVSFFLSYQTRCRTLGIEYDERLLERALRNRETAAAAGRTEFLLARAEEFRVPEDVDRFFFFNPFSVEILKRAVKRIQESLREREREVFLFFYYPSDEYLSYLFSEQGFQAQEEINCRDLFSGENPRERILVFKGL